MDGIKVAIVDDNQKIRFIIKKVLELEPDIIICDEARTLEEAKHKIQASSPDIVILDISMEDTEGGFKLLKDIADMHLATKAIILSAYDEARYAAKSFQAGARGYVCKDKMVKCLVKAIRAVYAGEQFVSSEHSG